MSFAHPILLLTLLVIPLAILAYRLVQRRRMRYAVRFTNMDVLASVVSTRRSWRRYVAPLVFLLALAALCVAVARPKVSTTVPTDQATVILVVDVSLSMQAHDVKPTRLGAAQKAIRNFLEHAPKKLRVGLIAFAGEPEVSAPPTTDHALVEQATNTLGLFEGYGGTAIGDALALAVQQAQKAVGPTSSPGSGVTIAYHPHGPQSPVAILFLSDGHQTRGILQPLEGAARAKEAGIPVYTVALGTPNGVLRMDGRFGGIPGTRFGQPFSQTIPVPPDPETLRQIAKTTGGKFTEARDARTLQAAYSSLGSRLGRKPGTTEITQWLVLIAVGLLLASGLAAARWAPRLP